MRKTRALFVLAMWLAGTAFAEPLDTATAAFKAGDYATAARLLLPLAESGERSAQYNLALMYGQGQGVPQDLAEALKWLRKAADQGDIDAQHDLGYVYHEGKGTPRDYAESAKWYRKAAVQGHPTSQFNVAFMYGTGQGVPLNFVEAYLWFSLAIEHLPASDGFNRGKAERNRDVIAGRMTPGQIAEAQKLAREWKPAN